MDEKHFTITSHTIVKNGMPFVPLVIKQVLPYMDRVLITISEKSNDGTKETLLELAEKNPKIEIDYENVAQYGELTQVRQRQTDKTKEDWILFLDDDDYWPKEDLEGCLKLLDDSIDGLAVMPYQLVDEEHYDLTWMVNNGRCFTKFFRNKDINYRGAWPKDLIFMGDKPLFWKKNKERVKRIEQYKFFHLAGLKPNSFRDTLTEFQYRPPISMRLDRQLPGELKLAIRGLMVD